MFLQKSSILVILETICPFVYSFLLKKLKESWSSQSFDQYMADTWFVCPPDSGVSATAVLNWHRQIPIQRLGAIATCLTCLLTCPGVGMCPDMSGCVGLNTFDAPGCKGATGRNGPIRKWPLRRPDRRQVKRQTPSLPKLHVEEFCRAEHHVAKKIDID